MKNLLLASALAIGLGGSAFAVGRSAIQQPVQIVVSQQAAAAAASTSLQTASIVIATGPGLGATPGMTGTQGVEGIFTTAFASITPQGGVVFVRAGTYTFTSTVNGYVPWNGRMICEDGAILTNSGDFAVFTVSGSVENCTVMPAGGITSQFFSMFSSSTARNITVRDTTNMGDAGRVFRANGVQNVKLLGINAYSNRSPHQWAIATISNSKNIQIVGGLNDGNSTTLDYDYEISGSTYVLFKDIIHSDDAGDAVLGIVSPGFTQSVLMTGCSIKSAAATSIGLIYGSGLSSGVIINGNNFEGNGAGNSRAINPQDVPAGTGWWTISNNTFSGFGSASVFVPANCSFFSMRGNRVYNGVFVNDSGTGSKYRTNQLPNNDFYTDTITSESISGSNPVFNVSTGGAGTYPFYVDKSSTVTGNPLVLPDGTALKSAIMVFSSYSALAVGTVTLTFPAFDNIEIVCFASGTTGTNNPAMVFNGDFQSLVYTTERNNQGTFTSTVNGSSFTPVGLANADTLPFAFRVRFSHNRESMFKFGNFEGTRQTTGFTTAPNALAGSIVYRSNGPITQVDLFPVTYSPSPATTMKGPIRVTVRGWNDISQ